MAVRSVVYEIWVNGQPVGDPMPDKGEAMTRARKQAGRKRAVSLVQLVIDENGQQRKAPKTVASWYDGQETS
jgi:hypothetical protein